ncbi:MAG: ISAs1 family transposase [Oscillospiraceae bacterium]|jgi:predicted transposase YbfD/YdcC|nr:ISAs1 family transposase [Oscillospiraceae bacterium]
MEKTYRLPEYFEEVETEKEHNGYFCSVKETLTIVILGSFCGLQNVKRIHQWAVNARVQEFLISSFGITAIPCYFWMLSLLKIIKPKSFNRCFINWVESLVPTGLEGYTVSFDGKTVCSTAKMEKYENPLHIVNAYIAELGITFGQQAVYEKSNEIPAVRELIGLLNLKGCMVVADALNCQKETAKAIIDAKADYLLNVKDNHSDLKEDIESYVQDDDLRKTMDTASTLEKSRDRIEKRTAFSTDDIRWLYGKNEWENLTCIGAIHTQFTTSKGTSDEWHYYISSRKLTADELLNHARLEWRVESMHWLLDVHFREDFCRVEDKSTQQNLNIIRKLVLNCIKIYKDKSGVKHPLSKIMFDCLLEPFFITNILYAQQN